MCPHTPGLPLGVPDQFFHSASKKMAPIEGAILF